MNCQLVDIQHFHQFWVHTFTELAVFIQHVGEAAGHARTKVDAGFAQHADDAAGHVFTTVVADAFYHGDGTGVTYGEAFPRTARSEQLAAGSAVQAGVADNAGFMTAERGANRWTHGDTAACHAFANVVVGVAGQG
ncbi:hypothetical protein D3C75_155370 [compost metagenome]